MALSFPSNPTNGQVYTDTVTGNRYLFNSTANVWSYAANNVGMSVSSTPPSNVAAGAMWYNRDIGRTFVYYDDGDSKQWVETVPATGTFDTSTVASYANAAAVLAVAPAYNTANAGYVVSNSAFGVANAGYVVSNAAFGKANNALANTSGVSFNGNLVFPNGNIGIGITPSFKLEIYDATNAYFRMYGESNVVQQLYRYSTDASSAQINLFKIRGTSSAASSVTANDITGRLIFYGYDGSGNYQTAEIRSAVDGAVSTGVMPGRLSFYTNAGSGSGSATERMRIDSSGNILVGTTSAPSGGLQIAVVGASTNRGYYVMGRTTAATSGVCGSLLGYNASQPIASMDFASNGATNSGFIQMYTWSAGTAVGGPYVNTGGTSWTTSSDERLKNIIGPIQDALSKVLGLRNIRYHLKNDESKTERVGFIAQDMQKILPEVVSEDREGMLGIDYATVTPLLAAAIQELKAELDAAKAEIETLKGN